METLTAPASLEVDIKKSRFVAHAAPVASVDEARAFFDRLHDATATHNCWAYRIGQSYRFNDDGEPSGTAGKPILQAIDGQGLDGVAVVVIRWFGGVKLGAGGLVRAYGGCAAQCLRDAPRAIVVPQVLIDAHCGFGEWPILTPRLATYGVVTQSEQYGAEGVTLVLSVPIEHEPALRRLWTDITRGKGGWAVVESSAESD
ncbi:YigZ family protein [Alcaligenaceae bacterium C4P045]|nr:YigZ family protein [Alcaligenaceae bacterium C4P045]